MMLAGTAAVGGALVLGLRASPEAAGEIAVPVQATDTPAVPEAEAVPSAEDRAAAYLHALTTSDLTTYTHPGGAFSFRYPQDFDLLTNSGGDEAFGNVLPPDLPLEIWMAVYPQGRYALDLPEDYETYTWPAPKGAERDAVVFLEQGEAFRGGYRGVIWFDTPGRAFESGCMLPSLDCWWNGWISFSH